jgi:hypothetical protein
MMNIIITSLAQAIVNAQNAKNTENQAKSEVKTHNQVKHETEDAIYKAICLIDGTSDVFTWSTDMGDIEFRFMFHDTKIMGTEKRGIITLKTRNKTIGRFYRSMQSGFGIVENDLGKRWSYWLLSKFMNNILAVKCDTATVPSSIIIDGKKLEVRENKVIFNNEMAVVEYDCMGHFCWLNGAKYEWIVDFIKKNFVK